MLGRTRGERAEPKRLHIGGTGRDVQESEVYRAKINLIPTERQPFLQTQKLDSMAAGEGRFTVSLTGRGHRYRHHFRDCTPALSKSPSINPHPFLKAGTINWLIIISI